MRLLLSILAVAIAAIAGIAAIALAGKPGLPDQGGIFTLADEAAGLKIPPKGTFARKLLSDGAASSVYAFKTKGVLPAHYHEEHDEIVYVVTGTAEFTLGTETKKIGPGDVLVIPACTIHSVKMDGETEALVINAPKMDPAAPDRIIVKDGEARDPYSACE